MKKLLLVAALSALVVARCGTDGGDGAEDASDMAGMESAGDMDAMEATAALPAVKGFFDGDEVVFVHPEASDRKVGAC